MSRYEFDPRTAAEAQVSMSLTSRHRSSAGCGFNATRNYDISNRAANSASKSAGCAFSRHLGGRKTQGTSTLPFAANWISLGNS